MHARVSLCSDCGLVERKMVNILLGINCTLLSTGAYFIYLLFLCGLRTKEVLISRAAKSMIVKIVTARLCYVPTEMLKQSATINKNTFSWSCKIR